MTTCGNTQSLRLLARNLGYSPIGNTSELCQRYLSYRRYMESEEYVSGGDYKWLGRKALANIALKRGLQDSDSKKLLWKRLGGGSDDAEEAKTTPAHSRLKSKFSRYKKMQ
jgi:hypothetical protein